MSNTVINKMTIYEDAGGDYKHVTEVKLETDCIPLSIISDIVEEIYQMNYLTIEDGSDGYDEYVDRYDVLKAIERKVKRYKDENDRRS